MKIQTSDVEKLAKLAHLDMSIQEAYYYAKEMSKIVNYIKLLDELDTANIEPMLGGLTPEGEQTYAIREDVPHESLGQDKALSQAPSAVSGHFQVPKVL
jgi:aspartyl-tRNA(Asn)/glutamyl-tRNA(Gln) amidotransferase subunit C